MLVCGVLGKVCARGVDAVGAICRTCQTCFQASYPLDEGLKTRDYAVCGAEWGARSLLQPVRDVALLAAFAMFRHVLKIPRKGSIVVPCVALHCLFAFIWHLSLILFSRIVNYAPSRSKQNLLS